MSKANLEREGEDKRFHAKFNNQCMGTKRVIDANELNTESCVNTDETNAECVPKLEQCEPAAYPDDESC